MCIKLADIKEVKKKMTMKELLQKAKTKRDDWEKLGEKKTLEHCLLNLIFDERYYFDDDVKNALLQEMAAMILDFRENRSVDCLEDNISEWHNELLEE